MVVTMGNGERILVRQPAIQLVRKKEPGVHQWGTQWTPGFCLRLAIAKHMGIGAPFHFRGLVLNSLAALVPLPCPGHLSFQVFSHIRPRLLHLCDVQVHTLQHHLTQVTSSPLVCRPLGDQCTHCVHMHAAMIDCLRWSATALNCSTTCIGSSQKSAVTSKPLEEQSIV